MSFLSSPVHCETVLRHVGVVLRFCNSRRRGGTPSNAYTDELVAQAARLHLSEEREWHLLLHYRANLFEGYTSEQDKPGFFMSPEGKTDPAAELAATLRKFVSTELVGRSKQPAQCAFIARYHWLKERLVHSDDTRLPPVQCERFDRWFAEFDTETISLIFPSAFMNNPASMFGHTFLRLDQRGQTEQTRILAYTINFAAEVPPGRNLDYAIRGIFGGYRGYFSTIPYYIKVLKDIMTSKIGISGNIGSPSRRTRFVGF